MSLIQKSPAYCFVSAIDRLECEDKSNIPTMAPLSAAQYLRGYYSKVGMNDSETPDRELLEQSVLHPYESLPVTINMSAEA